MRPARATAVLALLLLGPTADAAGEAAIEPPMTFKQVWIRGEKAGGWGGGRGSGELTITAQALEYDSKKLKKSRRIPLQSIVAVSFGRMRGDVDSSWAVLRYRVQGTSRIIGFRDGSKLGYGTATEEIYRALKETLRLTGTGQYAVRPGFQAYDELDERFTLAFPERWSTYHRIIIDAGDGLVLGRLVFSEAAIPEGRDAADAATQEQVERTLSGIDRGEIAAFQIVREEADRGMRCRGFSRQAARRLRERFGLAATEPATLGGCNGLQARTSPPADSALPLIDRRFVAHHGVLYVLSRRASAGDPQRGADAFVEALASLRFTDAY